MFRRASVSPLESCDQPVTLKLMLVVPGAKYCPDFISLAMPLMVFVDAGVTVMVSEEKSLRDLLTSVHSPSLESSYGLLI